MDFRSFWRLRNWLVFTIDSPKSFFITPCGIPFPKWMGHHISVVNPHTQLQTISLHTNFIAYTTIYIASNFKTRQIKKKKSNNDPNFPLGLFSNSLSISLLCVLYGSLEEEVVVAWLNPTTEALRPKRGGRGCEIKHGEWVLTDLRALIIICFLLLECIVYKYISF